MQLAGVSFCRGNLRNVRQLTINNYDFYNKYNIMLATCSSSPSVSLGVEYDCTARDLAGGVSEILFCSSGYLEVESCSSYAGIVCG